MLQGQDMFSLYPLEKVINAGIWKPTYNCGPIWNTHKTSISTLYSTNANYKVYYQQEQNHNALLIAPHE